jgi:hypothetical protein
MAEELMGMLKAIEAKMSDGDENKSLYHPISNSFDRLGSRKTKLISTRMAASWEIVEYIKSIRRRHPVEVIHRSFPASAIQNIFKWHAVLCELMDTEDIFQVKALLKLHQPELHTPRGCKTLKSDVKYQKAVVRVALFKLYTFMAEDWQKESKEAEANLSRAISDEK